MRAQDGFTDAQACGRLNGMPDAELGTIVGPGTDGSMYVIRAVTDAGVCLMGRATSADVAAVTSDARSLAERKLFR